MSDDDDIEYDDSVERAHDAARLAMGPPPDSPIYRRLDSQEDYADQQVSAEVLDAYCIEEREYRTAFEQVLMTKLLEVKARRNRLVLAIVGGRNPCAI